MSSQYAGDVNFTLFISSIRDGNTKGVTRLFRKEYISMFDDDRQTGLHHACMRDNIDIVRYLLDNGWNIECEDNNKCKPIHYAAQCGCISVVKELINRGCLLDVLNIDGNTAFNLALSAKMTECANTLQEAMIKKESSLIEENFNEFNSSIRNGDLDGVMRLFRIEYISMFDDYQIPGLHHACMNDNIDIVRYLLDNGWNIECEDIVKNRPIHMASRCGSLSIVKELINRGCMLDVRNNDGDTPLNISKTKNNTECLKLLVDGMAKEEDRITQLNFNKFISAITDCNIVDVKKFFRTEYINQTNSDSELTGLHHACMMGNIDIVRYLLNKGCDIECLDNNNNRPIHIATQCGHISSVMELIKRGCLLDVPNNDEHTPLIISTSNNFSECTEKLEEAIKLPEITRKMNRAINDLGKKEEELLGEGAFGKVIRFIDDEVGYDFAVKKVKIVGTLVAEDVEHIKNEINIYNKMDKHDRIVKYYGYHRDENAIYIFMERISEGSIADYLKEQGALGQGTIARYTKQSLDALTFLHGKQIIHRDIKSANILRDSHNNIKLCDFGLSRYLQNMSTYCTSDTTKSVCGTSYWMAPEVINGEDYSFSADVWSLGATVVEMLSGRHPYPSLMPVQAMLKIASTGKLQYESPEPISKAFQLFIDQMLVADPKHRANINSLMQSEFISNYQTP